MQEPTIPDAPEITPVLEIPILPERDGGLVTPFLHLSGYPAGTAGGGAEGGGGSDATLFIRHSPMDGRGLLADLSWQAPTIAAGLVIPLLVVLAIGLRRLLTGAVWAPGSVHCRRCGYQQASPVVGVAPGNRVIVNDPAARCSECGVALAKRPPRLAGPRWAQRVGQSWLAAAGLAGLAACLLVLGATLERDVFPQPDGRSWPSKQAAGWLRSWSGALAFRRPEPRGFPQQAVTRHRLPDGKPLGELCEFRVLGLTGAGVSPDGRWFAAVCVADPARPAALVVVRTANSAQRTVPEESMGGAAHWQEVAGFSRDGRQVYATRFAGGISEADNVLVAVDLDTGRSKEIARLRSARSPAASVLPRTTFLLDQTRTTPDGASPRWVAVTLKVDDQATSGTAEIVTSDHPGRVINAGVNITWLAPTLSRDGRTLFIAGFPGSPWVEVDLESGVTGPMTPGSSQALGASDDGEIQLRSIAGGLRVTNTRTGRSIPLWFKEGGWSASWPAAVSPGHRYVACFAVQTGVGLAGGSPGVPGGGQGEPVEGRVMVWDLTAGRAVLEAVDRSIDRPVDGPIERAGPVDTLAP